MAAVEAGFDESLENVSVSVGQKEVIRNSDFFKKKRTPYFLLLTRRLSHVIDFSLIVPCFSLLHGVTELFILVVCLFLDERSDYGVQRCAGQLCNVSEN